MTKSSRKDGRRTFRGGEEKMWSSLSGYKLLDYLCWPQSMYFRKVQIKALTTSSWIFQTSIFPYKIPNMNTAHPYLHCGWCRNKVNKVSSVHQHKHPKSRPSQCSNKPPKKVGIYEKYQVWYREQYPSLMYPVFQSTFFLYIVSTTNTCPLAFIRYLIATVVKG